MTIVAVVIIPIRIVITTVIVVIANLIIIVVMIHAVQNKEKSMNARKEKKDVYMVAVVNFF